MVVSFIPTSSIHHEKHFTSSEAVRDIIIGMADSLTAPFALAAGLAGAVSKTCLIFAAGVAEIRDIFHEYGVEPTPAAP